MTTQQVSGAKLTRKQAKARTRQKLIDALLEIAKNDGVSALSTTRITKRAGVAQSVFYDHFSDMNDALTVSAEQVGTKIRAALTAERKKIQLNDGQTIRDVFDAAISSLMAEPAFTDLLLRYRRDPGSPLGACIRGILDEERRSLIEDMAALGITEPVLPHAALHAEMIIGMTLTAVEGLLDGRLPDREACIDVLTSITGATVRAAMTPRSSS